MSILNPDLLRTMGDIDILVPEKIFDYSVQIADKLGYEYQQEPHSFDFHEKNSEQGTIDIHKYIYMDTKSEIALNEGLWQRAKQIKFLDLDFCLPSFEDFVFISLVNMARNFRNGTSSLGILYSFFDYKFLLEHKPDFDWQIVFNNAKLTGTRIHLLFSLLFVRGLMPEFFGEDLIKMTDTEKAQLEDYALKVLYNRFYIDELRQQSRKIKFKNMFQTKENFVQYWKVNSKYFFLKKMRNSVFAIKKIMPSAKKLKELFIKNEG